MRFFAVLPLLPTVLPAVLAGCSNNASLDVTVSTSSALALSAEEQAGDTSSGAASEAGDAGGGEPTSVDTTFTVTETSTVLLLHVVRTEAKVVAAAGDDDASGEDASDDDAEETEAQDDGPGAGQEAGSASESDDAGSGDASAGAEQAESENQDDTGWTVVSEEARDVDLLALTTSPQEIAAGDIPAGKLTQIRLVLEPELGAELVVGDVATPIVVPSGAQSGFKVSFAPPVELGGDEAASVAIQVDGTLERGNGQLMLRPVLRITDVARGEASDEAADAGQ